MSEEGECLLGINPENCPYVEVAFNCHFFKASQKVREVGKKVGFGKYVINVVFDVLSRGYCPAWKPGIEARRKREELLNSLVPGKGTLKELRELIGQGYSVYCYTSAGILPIRGIMKARGYSNDEEVKGFVIDLGTDGIAGHGYSDEELYNYFTEGYEVSHEFKKIIFSHPDNVKSDQWQGEGVEVTKCSKTILRAKDWQPRTKCGCI